MSKVITKIYGGLGNQMFQFAAAFGLASRSNAELLIDTTWFNSHSIHDGFVLNHLSLPDSVQAFSLSKLDLFFLKLHRKYKLPIGKHHNIPVFRDTDTLPTNGASLQLDGYWQNERYFKHVRKEILSFFKPSVMFSKDAQNAAKQIENSLSVSVHIRRGDYANDPNTLKKHGLTGIEFYHRAFEYITERHPNAQFYFFSDDIDWVKKTFADTPNANFFILPDTSPVVEMTLMSLCQHNIIANSTYSWWGAWLNDKPEKIVIAPVQWFADSKQNQEQNIVPNSWVKL